MIDKKNYVSKLIPLKIPFIESAESFAPSNIALCKYWGKKNLDLNTPLTPSLSISLGDRGTKVKLSISPKNSLSINGKYITQESPVFRRTFDFLELFMSKDIGLSVQSENNIPTAAGLASSASFFAALTIALDKLYSWHASHQALSCLARLGSGSACRSLHHGFVKWLAYDDPFQSYGIPIDICWEELRIGLLIFDAKEKFMPSRQSMLHTQDTSPLYQAWCENSYSDFEILHNAIEKKNFKTLGETAEYNALSLHAVMLAARPAIIYSQPETLEAIAKLHALRRNGLQIYFTQDAGPNLKLIFLENNLENVLEAFPGIKVINPFSRVDNLQT